MPSAKHIDTVLILGSGPNATLAAGFPRERFDRIVVINNAWKLRPDWDVLIHPDDFPEDRHPAAISEAQTIITARDYVPIQNSLGGFVYAGGTMAFTAAYWVLQALAPKAIAFLGCDMVYPQNGPTHFYGTGAPDPLRDDVTLRSLEAKSARFAVFAAKRDTAVVNLSHEASRLTFPRSTLDDLAAQRPIHFNEPQAKAALALEQKHNYFAASGRYWEVEDQFDPAVIDQIDALWLGAVRADQPS